MTAMPAAQQSHLPHAILISSPTIRGLCLRRLGLTGLALACATPLFIAAAGVWLAMPVTTQSAAAIAVNGGGTTRTSHAIALYHQGLAPELWHTAYPVGAQHVTAAVIAQGGVPPTAFRFLASANTWDDGRQIAAQLQSRQIQSVLLVTDWWHSRRALCALQAHLGGANVQVAFSPAPAPVGPLGWWRDHETRSHVLRELVAIPYYTLRYGMWPFNCG
jgi:uncharacterized SAM-binding protein YcdF (DUF218 family)